MGCGSSVSVSASPGSTVPLPVKRMVVGRRLHLCLLGEPGTKNYLSALKNYAVPELKRYCKENKVKMSVSSSPEPYLRSQGLSLCILVRNPDDNAVATVHAEREEMLVMKGMGAPGELQIDVMKKRRKEREEKEQGVVRKLHYFRVEDEEKAIDAANMKIKFFRDGNHLARLVLLDVRMTLAAELPDIVLHVPEIPRISNRMAHLAYYAHLATVCDPSINLPSELARDLCEYIQSHTATSPIVFRAKSGSGISTALAHFTHMLYNYNSYPQVKEAVASWLNTVPPGRRTKQQQQFQQLQHQLQLSQGSPQMPAAPIPDELPFVVINHVVGVTEGSRTPMGLYRNIVRTIRYFFGDCGNAGTPVERRDMVRSFKTWINHCASGSKCLIIIIDGFHLFEDDDVLHPTNIFPTTLPPNVKLVITAQLQPGADTVQGTKLMEAISTLQLPLYDLPVAVVGNRVPTEMVCTIIEKLARGEQIMPSFSAETINALAETVFPSLPLKALVTTVLCSVSFLFSQVTAGTHESGGNSHRSYRSHHTAITQGNTTPNHQTMGKDFVLTTSSPTHQVVPASPSMPPAQSPLALSLPISPLPGRATASSPVPAKPAPSISSIASGPASIPRVMSEDSTIGAAPAVRNTSMESIVRKQRNKSPRLAMRRPSNLDFIFSAESGGVASPKTTYKLGVSVRNQAVPHGIVSNAFEFVAENLHWTKIFANLETKYQNRERQSGNLMLSAPSYIPSLLIPLCLSNNGLLLREIDQICAVCDPKRIRELLKDLKTAGVIYGGDESLMHDLLGPNTDHLNLVKINHENNHLDRKVGTTDSATRNLEDMKNCLPLRDLFMPYVLGSIELREFILYRYVFSIGKQLKEWYALLANHWEKQRYYTVGVVNERILEELPHASLGSQQWITLRACVSDLTMYRALGGPRHSHNLALYWQALNEHQVTRHGKNARPGLKKVQTFTEFVDSDDSDDGDDDIPTTHGTATNTTSSTTLPQPS